MRPLARLTAEEKRIITLNGHDWSCRCPKPCAQHSAHYRQEMLTTKGVNYKPPTQDWRDVFAKGKGKE